MYALILLVGLACVGSEKEECSPTKGGVEDPCDGIDNDCNGQTDEAGVVGKPTWYADNDNDSYGDVNGIVADCIQPLGYVSDSADCDDANPDVNPAAAEDCDGVDNNCENGVDEGLRSIQYLDDDGDGYGSSTSYYKCTSDSGGMILIGGDCDDGDSAVNPTAIEVCNNIDDDCDMVTDVVDNDGDGFYCSDDCDDTDAEVNPNATEYCDGIDNNCDRVVDEDSAADATTWYTDLDADGYGDDGATTEACARIGGTSGTGGDCADFLPAINPGATEVCDGLDNNCDGLTDDVSATNAKTWYADSDGDGYGDPNTATIACDQPVAYIRKGEDCNDTNSLYNPGAAERNCADPNDYNCDGSVGYTDADGDGFAACQECDDSEAAVNPNATEVCDGIDNNCDGSTDGSDATGQLTWYADADNDGFGNDYSVTACDRPDHYADISGDCNDSNALVSPANAEACDGIDNNCDGVVDEDEATWYADTDSDGYGDPATAVTDCTQPPGYVTDDTDCDDSDSATNPGVVEDCADPNDYNCDGSAGYSDADGDGAAACEDCNDNDAAVNPGATEVCDGLDNDCDGSADDGAADATTWYEDQDEDTYGDGAISALSCTQPTGYVANATDCNDSNFAANPAATEVCDGFDNDCDGLTDGGDAIDQLTWYMDSDGDGYGGTASTTLSCTQPTGYSANATDCDDTAANAFPGNREVCDDGIDGACNGTWDEVCTGGDSGDSAVDSGSGGDSGGADTSGGDSGGGHSGGDSTDSTPVSTVLYYTDFGDGSICATDPFVRSDGGTMAFASYDDGAAGGCGVYVFGGGSASGPSVALSYSASGYTESTVYTAWMTVKNVETVSITFYTDFGGGTIVPQTVASGSTVTVGVSWDADSSGSATLRAWTEYSTNYGLVIEDLVISY